MAIALLGDNECISKFFFFFVKPLFLLCKMKGNIQVSWLLHDQPNGIMSIGIQVFDRYGGLGFCLTFNYVEIEVRKMEGYLCVD